jgi:hypothetical protein
VQTANAALAWLGLFGIIVGALNVTAAYGLLKLQAWAMVLATIALASSIVLSATHIWLDHAARGYAVHTLIIAIAAVSLWYLHKGGAKQLYAAQPGGRAVTA